MRLVRRGISADARRELSIWRHLFSGQEQGFSGGYTLVYFVYLLDIFKEFGIPLFLKNTIANTP